MEIYREWGLEVGAYGEKEYSLWIINREKVNKRRKGMWT